LEAINGISADISRSKLYVR